MANKRFWIGILVMVLVFGMAVFGCDNSDDTNNYNGNGNGGGGGSKTDSALNGTWIKENGEMSFNNGYFENFVSSLPFIKGNYTINGNRYTRTVTHMGGKYVYPNLELSKWYTKNELITLGYNEATIGSGFNTNTAIYSVDENNLILTFDGTVTPEIWSKR